MGKDPDTGPGSSAACSHKQGMQASDLANHSAANHLDPSAVGILASCSAGESTCLACGLPYHSCRTVPETTFVVVVAWADIVEDTMAADFENDPCSDHNRFHTARASRTAYTHCGERAYSLAAGSLVAEMVSPVRHCRAHTCCTQIWPQTRLHCLCAAS